MTYAEMLYAEALRKRITFWFVVAIVVGSVLLISHRLYRIEVAIRETARCGGPIEAIEVVDRFEKDPTP